MGPDNPHGCTNKCAVNMCKGQVGVSRNIVLNTRTARFCFVASSRQFACVRLEQEGRHVQCGYR